jgi:hypothetical protein
MLRRIALSMPVVAVAGALLGGCGAPEERVFRITSFPDGATIYVNGREEGTTDKNLMVGFAGDPYVTLRLEKRGFQPTGLVLTPHTADELSFFLQESPENRRIIELLDRIGGLLNEVIAELRNLQTSKN